MGPTLQALLSGRIGREQGRGAGVGVQPLGRWAVQGG